jgi:cell division protein ZapA
VNEEPVPVTVRILDKEYRVACQPNEQQGLIDSARMLDQRMREIRQTGRVVGTERIAVMAGLNIAHELLTQQRDRNREGQDLAHRLAALQGQMAEALADQHRLDDAAESV